MNLLVPDIFLRWEGIIVVPNNISDYSVASVVAVT